MFSQVFELPLPGVAPQDVAARAEPFRGGRHRGLWIRVDGDRLTARYLTSGRLAADGVLRARLRPEAGPQGGTRIAGRMRWGNLGVFVSLYLACAAAVGAMAVFYANGVIGLVTLAPLGMAALYAGTALRSRGRDARELELRLRRVLQG
ncbi:hypothetical protein SAMN05421803_13317 [Nocardiopsis flavescens]|uniref:Uncharacterized protein n=1 Tax=Nocardiopsis flavescens TaxID=758803 RepID=A0A1M6V9V8_9ACTN|nr:hypothetical protein [Nocardiopsis flavescens]SHK78144.1 hypothetical protein SAMN05421803_13317 [Nocardiopsis flavescens]